MKTRIISKGLAVGITILFLGTCITPTVAIQTVKESSIPISSGNTLYVGGTGPGNYTSIQDAIDDASNGDTVFVFNDSSPYYENVVVDKSINLVGEDKNTTVIDGSWNYYLGYVVKISANAVNICGFTIQFGYYHGIYMSSYFNVIKGNKILNNGDGICLYYSSYNLIEVNNILNNNYGINFDKYSNYNTIKNNNINSNKYCGILFGIYSSNSNIILNNNFLNNIFGIGLAFSQSNKIINNSFFNDGLFVLDSQSNKIENNTINGKPLVYLEHESDIVIDYEVGQVILVNCNKITVEKQNLSNTYVGIELWKSDNCLIRNNYCSEIRQDIYLFYSNNNLISGNNISIRDYGIYLVSSNENIISGNNISKNSDSIYLSGSSSNNTITANIISNNSWNGIRIGTNPASNNSIIRNKITNNLVGINLDGSSRRSNITENIISNNNKGIILSQSYNNNIEDNNILKNNFGIILKRSPCKYNIIKKNNISRNWNGIELSFFSNNNSIIDNKVIYNEICGINIFCEVYSNRIIGNNISSNIQYGVNISEKSNDNIIFRNNFINNGMNANDNCYNFWDDNEYGNYWSDYEEKYPDAKKKPLRGIWDTPYEIEGGNNIDKCPLINQWPKPRTRTIPRTQTIHHPILQWLIERFPLLERLLSFLLL